MVFFGVFISSASDVHNDWIEVRLEMINNSHLIECDRDNEKSNWIFFLNAENNIAHYTFIARARRLCTLEHFDYIQLCAIDPQITRENNRQQQNHQQYVERAICKINDAKMRQINRSMGPFTLLATLEI